jgi:hydroxymethylpyrimidine/phosphomethylpyrimidine kinase
MPDTPMSASPTSASPTSATPMADPPMSATPPVVLTIAGSDSGGGAGIQADLVTFAALGVHGASAITALTAQNTMEVTAVHVPPVDILRDQLDAVLDDLAVSAVKTGMLATEEVVLAVAEYAAAGRLPNLVVDPVLVSSTGARLLDPGAEAAYREALFPHALVVTPNTREAAALLGTPVATLDDARDAAGVLARWGPRWVVVKGGHLGAGAPARAAVGAGDVSRAAAGTGDVCCDVVVEAATGAVTELCLPRVDTPNDHGTGCTFGAATAATLARGASVPDALEAAKRFVHEGLERSAGWALGAGHGPVGKLGGWA